MRDALAGITLAAMNVPQALGYARIAGMVLVHTESSLRADLHRLRLSDVIGTDHIFDSLREALAAISGHRAFMSCPPRILSVNSSNDELCEPAGEAASRFHGGPN